MSIFGNVLRFLGRRSRAVPVAAGACATLIVGITTANCAAGPSAAGTAQAAAAPVAAPDATPAAAPAAAAQPEAIEEWQLMYMGDAKVGFVHIVTEQIERDGRLLWKTFNDSAIAMNRLGTNVTVLQSSSTFEDEAGNVVRIEAESNMAAAKTRTVVEVKGDRAEMVQHAGGPPQVKSFDWDPEWIGVRAADRITRAQIQAGAKSFVLKNWTPDQGAVVLTTELQGEVKVAVPGRREETLLHSRSTLDILPGVITESWTDPATLDTVMTLTKMGGALTLRSVASDKAECLAAFANPDTPEMFDRMSPRTNVRLPDPYRCDELLVRVRVADPEMPLPPLADERQVVVESAGKDDLLLRVSRVVPQQGFALPLSGLTAEEQECLGSNLMIDHVDPAITALAKQVVGDETDAWSAACRLERFAYEHISDKSMSKLFEPASKVCSTRSGDCTEHGVLLAALCRAAGIPSRVAVGFLYFKGIWGGHMWTEVSLGGKWYALDAVLGRGGIDAAHLRLAADSLMTSEIGRVFGNVMLGMTMDIDITAYRHGDKEVKVGEEMKVYALDGGRYRHLLFDLSFATPEGLTVAPNERIKLGDDEIVELLREGGGKIEVAVVDVTYDTKLDDAKGVLEAHGMTRLKPADVEVDGRKAKRYRGKKDKAEALALAALRDQTLLLITAPASEEAAFEVVVGSLDLDG